MKKIIYICLGGALLLGACSKDFMDKAPESYISEEQLGASSEAAKGSLRGILAGLRSYGISGYGGHEDYGHKSMLSIADLMGNDVVMNALSWNGFYYNYAGRITTSSRSHMPWFTYYIQIKNTNTIINSIDVATASAESKYIRAQALALRGYFHLMLTRFYAPTYVGNESAYAIPINTGEVSKFRNKNQEVYAQIEKDLKEAVEELAGYQRENKELIDQSVAQAFLAEAYLEMGKFSEAAQAARKARQGYGLLDEKGWKNGFYDINQDETMWGADITSELTTFVANFFSHFDNTGAGYSRGGNIAIDKRLYDAIPDTDYRKSMFLSGSEGEFEGKTYPAYTSFKFRDLTEDGRQGDYIYLRSSLMYYIEAEALAKSGNEDEAKNILFEITSKRDSGYQKSTKTGSELIDEIILQKRIEMWGEGWAFFDLKRLGKGVERNYTDSNHGQFGKLNIPASDPRFLIQIPEKEIDATPTMVPNNP
ncbi:RagB/SusD family nutrient uptake outer membrane protein [Capnocytophaga sp.]|uniref:RagB/SusD family nutrient uptake outer membrane protein n=1 Tax=Capnocytophaga sp. TaxID=44737 RepID=UPI0026DB4FFF|nr:RagB/SusD family nutrient uptake outer membrane protein [Capnocytophaga sp.]MDO5105417.1 RagB/SusD family nutrient uptake outer membrane protein [Capnocytophaga sp.]